MVIHRAREREREFICEHHRELERDEWRGKYEKVITGHLTVCENENDGDGGSIKSSRHFHHKNHARKKGAFLLSTPINHEIKNSSQQQ